MEELEGYFWESIYILKQMYDHGCGDELLSYYKNVEINGDIFYEIAIEAIDQVFEDTRRYYNEDREIETYVFFDREIDEFCRLCEEYESARGIEPENNPFRKSTAEAIRQALNFGSYSYDYIYYFDGKMDGRKRLVLLLGVEFCNHYEIPGGLLEVKADIAHQSKRLRQELAIKAEVITLPRADADERMAA